MKVPTNIKEVIKESLRDWFKKEKWVRISSSGKIAGDCGTSKNKKNPDRCLPKAKAQSLTKGQRAATAAKKKKAGSKGKTVVKNTKKATVKKESKYHNEDLSKMPTQDQVDKFFASTQNKIHYLNSKPVAGQEKTFNKMKVEPWDEYDLSNFNSLVRKAKSKGQLKETKKTTVKKEGKSAEELKSHIKALSKARAQAASKGQTSLLNSYHKEISKAQKQLKKLTPTQEGLWANINAKKKAGKKSSHKNSNAYKDAKKAGTSLEKTKEGVTKEDIRNLVVGTIYESTNENTIMEKDDRCTRLAKSKYDTWPSAYASGAVVRCRRGEIWKKK